MESILLLCALHLYLGHQLIRNGVNHTTLTNHMNVECIYESQRYASPKNKNNNREKSI